MSDAVTILSTQLQGQLATPSAWLVGTTYVAGVAVSRSGLNYYAIQGSTGADPATDGGINWGLLTGSGAQASTILATSSAVVAGARAVAVSRQARRVSLLNAVLIPALLPVNTRVGDIASAWNECSEANQFLAAAVDFDTELNVLRATDSTGKPLAGVISNIPFANYASWGAALVASAGVYETLLGESLPA